MPVYKLSKALSAINTHTKDVTERYKNTLVYAAYVPVGTSLYDFGGYALGFADIDTKDLYDDYFKIKMINSNTITLSVPIDRLAHGLVLTVSKSSFGYAGGIVMKSETYVNSRTIQITKSQLAQGFVYSTIYSESLLVKMVGNQLTFSSTPIPAGSPNIGTGYSFSSSNWYSLLFESIKSY